MAHYAFLNEDSIVTEVIVGIDETELIEGKDPETWYGEFRQMTCKRTSYNGNFRKNYAVPGFLYSQELDAFVPPKPFNSWILDQETAKWTAPVIKPQDGLIHEWNEDTLSWIEVPPTE